MSRARSATRHRPRNTTRCSRKITTDFNARFLGKDGIYREKADEPFLQTAQILPLAFDLVPAAQRTAVAERLATTS